MADGRLQQHQQSVRQGGALPGLPHVAVPVRRDFDLSGGRSLNITSATPGVFAQNYAAVPGISTDQSYPLPKRAVVDHHFTGTDVPLLSAAELKARLGSDYPDPYETGRGRIRHSEGAGHAPSEAAGKRRAHRREHRRIRRPRSARRWWFGWMPWAFPGIAIPAGFSQERTAYVQLAVTDDNGFVLYQSGYLVDKPHPDTGEMQPDGNLDDEDNEHIHAVVDGGHAVPVGSYATGRGQQRLEKPGVRTGPRQRPGRPRLLGRGCRAGAVPQRTDRDLSARRQQSDATMRMAIRSSRRRRITKRRSTRRRPTRWTTSVRCSRWFRGSSATGSRCRRRRNWTKWA